MSCPHVLPPPPEESRLWFIHGFCGFGYDRTNDVYKVLYFGCSGKHANYYLNDYGSRGLTYATEFNLYTLGIGKGKDTLRRINHYDNQIGLFVNGALHWIMSSKDSVNCRNVKAKIISFVIEKEEFGEIQKPQSIPEEDEYYGGLQVLQGCLCMCQFLNGLEDIDVWMLKDYAVEGFWTKTFTISLRNSSLHFENAIKLLRLNNNGEIVMGRDADSVIVYDPINRIARHVENIALENFLVHQMIHVESLVSLNTGIYCG